jgi:hypothetical protein
VDYGISDIWGKVGYAYTGGGSFGVLEKKGCSE